MKKPSNKAKAIYLTWELMHLALLFFPRPDQPDAAPTWGGRIFYPFTKGEFYTDPITEKIVEYPTNWDVRTYDLTEFVFYTIAPILIYYIATLFFSKEEADK